MINTVKSTIKIILNGSQFQEKYTMQREIAISPENYRITDDNDPSSSDSDSNSIADQTTTSSVKRFVNKLRHRSNNNESRESLLTSGDDTTDTIIEKPGKKWGIFPRRKSRTAHDSGKLSDSPSSNNVGIEAELPASFTIAPDINEGVKEDEHDMKNLIHDIFPDQDLSELYTQRMKSNANDLVQFDEYRQSSSVYEKEDENTRKDAGGEGNDENDGYFENDTYKPETNESFNMNSGKLNGSCFNKYDVITPITPVEKYNEVLKSTTNQFQKLIPRNEFLADSFYLSENSISYRNVYNIFEKISKYNNLKITHESLKTMNLNELSTNLLGSTIKLLEKMELSAKENIQLKLKLEGKAYEDTNLLEERAIQRLKSELIQKRKTEKKIKKLKKLVSFIDVKVEPEETDDDLDEISKTLKIAFEEIDKVEEENKKLKSTYKTLKSEYNKLKLESIEKSEKHENAIESEKMLKQLQEENRVKVDSLKDTNKGLKKNYQSERSKVLQLRKEVFFLKYRIQLIDCYRTESLQFMSQFMSCFRNCVDEDALSEYDSSLKNLNRISDLTVMVSDDSLLEETFKLLEGEVFHFYEDVAKAKFLDQIVSKYVTCMGSYSVINGNLEQSQEKYSKLKRYSHRLHHENRRLKRQIEDINNIGYR